MKKLLHVLACAAFVYSGQSLAVFCTAQEYVYPTTGNSVWLFGDIHCDVDPMMIMTRLQQHTLLEAAEKCNATIIAENVDYKLYDFYPWIARFGIDAALFYKAFKDTSYNYLIAGTALTALHITNWRADKSKTQKPSVSLTNHIAHLKKSSVVTSLPCYAASPLWSLVQEANKRGIPGVDLEFRYHMVGAYARANLSQLPMFLQTAYAMTQDAQAWMNRKITGNIMRYPITLADYFQVNDAIVAEIESYDDEPILRDFYKKCIEDYTTSYMTVELREWSHELGSDVSQAITLADIVVPTLVGRTGKDTSTILRDFAEHNVTLFDARLIHSIVNHKNTNAFVCTGAYHVRKITEILEQLGYKAKSAYGKNNLKTLEARGAIGRTFMQLDDLDYLAIDLDKVFARA